MHICIIKKYLEFLHSEGKGRWGSVRSARADPASENKKNGFQHSKGSGSIQGLGLLL